ncbi:MAG TPA: DNA polymerase III subunit epsilon [Candidatus Sulfotelmatobacter sp.]|nr:DNA polymerase III subunit epsilon [Candidatus Sulfotelmatobacter sp.]
MREIVLDTETTGLDPNAGHRIVEIAGVELMNSVPTGQVFQRYINPERDMPEEAFAIHGLSDSFLREHPLFASIVDELLGFIGDATLVIHNAEFDMRFINAELARCERAPLGAERAMCTLQLARRRFPGTQVSLDALCRRFGVDNTQRTKHGALLDAELLAEVYLELIGGRQHGLELAAAAARVAAIERVLRPARPHAPTVDELAAHAVLLAQLKEPLWMRGEASTGTA